MSAAGGEGDTIRVASASRDRGSSSTTNNPTNPRKRQRTLVSCTECHRRKQKCDRQWPCGNCTSRSANHLCQYERKANRREEERTRRTAAAARTESVNTDDSAGEPTDDSDELDSMTVMTTRSNAREFGYSNGIHNTSLNVLEKLEIGCDSQLHPVYSDRTFKFTNHGDLTTYNNFIRLIPARPYTNLLVQVFFAEVNFFYGMLHQATFNKMLDEWWTIATTTDHSHLLPSNDPVGIANPHLMGKRMVGGDPYIHRDIHFFPALLLQVLACALQLLPREHHEYLSQMKIGMLESFHDLSARLSNASCELAVLLGGTGTLSLARMQQAFYRASWLKSEGRMHESWHSLGMAIRSAQEQGLHLENGKQGPGGMAGLMGAAAGGRGMGGVGSMAEQIRNMWYREMEKRVWINLYAWDRFMSMLLGRPTMINDRHCTVKPPMDCEIPADLSLQEPTPRGVMEAPTVFTARLLEFRLCHLINELDDLNQAFSTSGTPDFVQLDALHARVMAFAETFPPEFALNNRDTGYDTLRPLIPVQAALLKCTFYSIVVALHRPYLFIREKSRREIVRACLYMLESQDTLMKILKEHHYRIYAINFYTFDPSVLISAVIITNCAGMDQETVEESLVALRAAWRRLRMLGGNVKLAEKGAVVLRVLLKKVESVAERWRWKRDNGRISSPAPSRHPFMNSQYTSDRQSPPSSEEASIHPQGSSPDHRQILHLPPLGSTSTMLPGIDTTAPDSGRMAHVDAESGLIDTLSTMLSYHPHQHSHHHPATTMPLQWDSAVLVDVPVGQIGTSPPLPLISSTTGATVGSTTAFDFGKSHHDSTGGGYPPFSFDGVGYGSHQQSTMTSEGGIPSVGGGGQNRNGPGGLGGGTDGEETQWGNIAPHGDGLWQNLLGMFDN